MIDPEQTRPDLLDDFPQTRLDVGDSSLLCGVCSATLRATRYVHVESWSVHVVCSSACFRDVVRERRGVRWAARRRYARRATVAAVLIGAFLTPHGGPPGRRPVARAAPVIHRPDPTPSPGLPPGWYGPEWPPSETSVLASLGNDAWIHPLAGPVRRMPRADSRVFGAGRPGERPAECRNGHCGVDLGGEIWGEQVRAAHDGVVDFVQRGANPDRGGEFVRIAHHDGTVFTQYFHLAAIPRGLERGVRVKSGDVIGLLGDTGVKESAPHLHFAISVRPSKEWPERYIDPEPLIALWPVRVPIDGSEAGLVTTVARPGLPLGSALLSPGHRRKAAKAGKQKRGGHPGTDSDAEAGDRSDANDASAGNAGDDTAPDRDREGARDSAGDE